MKNNIFFDLDGTLTDPGEGITNSVAYALEKFSISVSDKRELYPFIGPPLAESFMEIYGFTSDQAQLAIRYYREYYEPKGIFENRLYDGIDDMLKSLKAAGKTLILATSKPEEMAIRVLKKYGIFSYFDFICGASMDETRTEKADVIRYALSVSGASVPDSVMVGDRKYDMVGAHENGMQAVGVLFGYGSREELEAAGADHITASVSELKKYLTEI
ncbi:MAG: HAD family hydrolase [Acutalibacteraceae bacterium]|nr:HAD family hydrolase [Oscillospiraceae bacterium]